MRSISHFLACGLTLVTAASSSPLSDKTPHYFQRGFTRRDITPSQVRQELGPQLSNCSSIFGPSSSAWTNATHRWNTYVEPTIQVVVEVGTEADVSIVVRAVAGYR